MMFGRKFHFDADSEPPIANPKNPSSDKNLSLELWKSPSPNEPEQMSREGDLEREACHTMGMRNV